MDMMSLTYSIVFMVGAAVVVICWCVKSIWG